jgi:hypothetical protein
MFLQFAENEVPLHMVTKPYFDSIIKILFYQYKNEKKRTANTKIFRVLINKLLGAKKNTIIKTKSPVYNGKRVFQV